MALGSRDRIEQRFEAWGRTVCARPLPILLASLALALACASGLSRLTVDVSFDSFLAADDPVRVSYDAFRAQFGRDERIIIAAHPGASASAAGVFELAFLDKLRALHEAIEARAPYLDDVTSLANARDTRGDGDTLRVEDFLDPWPEDATELVRLRDRAIANPLFRNTVISADGEIATVVLDLQLYSSIGAEEDLLSGFESSEAPSSSVAPGSPPLLTGSESAELVRELYAILDELEGPDFVLSMAGSPVMVEEIGGSMAREMPRFIVLALASIALFLFLLFRSLVAVAIPLAVVALSVASTMGLMGWSGHSIHVPTQILPTFLLAVGIGDSVHLLSIFFERLREGDDRSGALCHALGHSGLALVLTSVTTAGGLASFIGAAVAPVAAIGLFAPIGVMIALGLSLTLLPAALALAPLGRGAGAGAGAGSEVNRIDRLLAALGSFAVRRPRTIVIASLALALVAALGAARLGLSHDPLGWLDESVRMVRATRFVDQALGGSISFEVLLETQELGGVRRPEALRQLAELGRSLEEDPRDGLVAGQTTSLADVVKEIHRALNEDRPEAYAIPDDPRLVSQELLLFENTGTDDLEELVDSEYRMARVSVRMPWQDAVAYRPFFALAEADIDTTLASVGRPSTTGILSLLTRAISALVTSLARSYLIAFLVITPLMVLLLGSLRMGLLAMIPNGLPILLTLGLMGFLALPLDAFSLLIGGIALGLAVDDTIHFMHNFRRYRDRGDAFEDAVAETLRTTGRAMLITTVVLTTGFAGFMLSSMKNLSHLGLLVGFAITTAFLADVLLAPALLALFGGRSGAKQSEPGSPPESPALPAGG